MFLTREEKFQDGEDTHTTLPTCTILHQVQCLQFRDPNVQLIPKQLYMTAGIIIIIVATPFTKSGSTNICIRTNHSSNFFSWRLCNLMDSNSSSSFSALLAQLNNHDKRYSHLLLLQCIHGGFITLLGVR